jgi:protein ImuA
MKKIIRPDILEDLQERIHRIDGFQRQIAAGVATGFDALDQLLPGSGLKRGGLTEWLGDGEGSGVVSLALAVAAHVLRQEGAFVVIDKAGEFYPVAAAQMGIPLERTVVVRPDSSLTALWAWEQSLRCPGVAVTLGWIDSLDDRLFRRLQLAAETGGSLGFLLRRPDCRSGPSWAAMRIFRMLQTRNAERGMLPVRNAECGMRNEDRNTGEDSLGWRLQLSLIRGRNSLQCGTRNSKCEIEIYETSNVPVVSQLADPAAMCSAAG